MDTGNREGARGLSFRDQVSGYAGVVPWVMSCFRENCCDESCEDREGKEAQAAEKHAEETNGRDTRMAISNGDGKRKKYAERCSQSGYPKS
jgi:hypothetical protein